MKISKSEIKKYDKWEHKIAGFISITLGIPIKVLLWSFRKGAENENFKR
jgi:hypothetical protein